MCMILFDDEGWYMIFIYIIMIHDKTLDLKTNSNVQFKVWSVSLGREVKSTQFEGFLNAWKLGVWRNSLENSASLRSTILVAMNKSPQKNQVLICPIQLYGSWHGFREKEGLSYLKITSCCFNNRCLICFPTHPQAHFTFHACTTVGSAPRSRMCVFFVPFPSESSWMCLLLLLIQGFQISLWLGLASWSMCK